MGKYFVKVGWSQATRDKANATRKRRAAIRKEIHETSLKRLGK